MSQPKAYGYPLELDGAVTTVVTASDSYEEFQKWTEQLDTNDGTFTYYRAMTMLDKLKHDSEFRDYRGTVIFVFHDDNSLREQFMENYNVVSEQSAVALDRHKEMLHKQEENYPYLGGGAVQYNDETTIEEKYGLDKYDPWDHRSEEEKQREEERQKEIEEAAKQKGMSGPFNASPDGAEGDKEQDRKGIGITNTRRENDNDITVVGVDMDQHSRKDSHVEGESDSTDKDDWDPDLMDKIEVVHGSKSGGGLRGQTASNIDSAKSQRDASKINPRDFARALAGDRTSTISSTGSHGKDPVYEVKMPEVPAEVKNAHSVDEVIGKGYIVHAPERMKNADNARSLCKEVVTWGKTMCDGWIHQVETGVFVLGDENDVERVHMKIDDLEVEIADPEEDDS